MKAKPTLRDHDAYAIEVLGMPEGWQAFRWSVVAEECPQGFIKITGAVCPHLYKSGSRKGQTNYKLRTLGTEKTLFINKEQFRLWFEQQETTR